VSRLVPLDQASLDAFGFAVDTPLLYLVYLPLFVGFIVAVGGLVVGKPARLSLLALLLVGCNAAQAHPAPPLVDSASADWSYALRLIGIGDVEGARGFLERAAVLGGPEADQQAQFYRDLAEVRLAASDMPRTLAAVQLSRTGLDAKPATARFKDEERRRFRQELDALEAAALGDVNRLAQLTRADGPPVADTWYLLGGTYERRGELEAARAAYRAYLDRAPPWSFLRTALVMQRHAHEVLAAAASTP
jgi:hypothetical protein